MGSTKPKNKPKVKPENPKSKEDFKKLYLKYKKKIFTFEK